MIEIQTDPAPQPDQPDWCTCTYCREMAEGEKVCCKENSERCHSRMPVNIIFFIRLLLFCCMILFLSFVVTPVLTLPSPCNLLFVCNIHCTISCLNMYLPLK